MSMGSYRVYASGIPGWRGRRIETSVIPVQKIEVSMLATVS